MVQKERAGLDIAIIGMSGAFPGAADTNVFWDNLRQARESISFATAGELMAAGVPAGLVNNESYVPCRGGVLEGKDRFDAGFFGYQEYEAELMDPQVRLFHEHAHRALEDAGYTAENHPGAIGLFAAASAHFEWQAQALLSPVRGNADAFSRETYVNRDFLCSRVAYKLNLKGPVIALQTACSSSLVAVHMACRSILMGECELALSGGVSAREEPETGYLYQEGMIRSPDGHCRAFDADAKGTVAGEGIGVIVLKLLAHAVRDRDNIYAVIKGTSIQNDGSRKAGYSAPSVEGQAATIRAALRMARVPAESIGLIEAHGTGTAMGDPAEFEALKAAFATDKRQYCALGSVKTNIGHLDAAAGIAGLIKVVLAIRNRMLPASLHYRRPNPNIEFEQSPFYINTITRDWERSVYPLRAGVSSFGIGGTNAHVILEEAPGCGGLQEGPGYEGNRGEEDLHLILLSARSEAALVQMCGSLRCYLETHSEVSLKDVAYTLMAGRSEYPFRRAFVCRDVRDAIEKLALPFGSGGAELADEKKKIVFYFSGIPVPEKDRILYEREAVYRAALDECGASLEGAAGTVAMEYALCKLLNSWGILPDAVTGSGYGEYAAICSAGIIEPAYGVRLCESGVRAEAGGMEKILKGMRVGKARWPVISGSQGRYIQEDELSAIHYWKRLADQNRHPAGGSEWPVIAGAHLLELMSSGMEGLLRSIGECWSGGGEMDLIRLSLRAPGRRISLPTYPFDRKSYRRKQTIPAADPEMAGLYLSCRKHERVEEWLYAPVWEQSLPLNGAGNTGGGDKNVLVFAATEEQEQLAAMVFAGQGCEMCIVRPGSGFVDMGAGVYSVDPADPESYDRLFNGLRRSEFRPDKLIHLWTYRNGVSCKKSDDGSRDLLMSMYSLIYICQAIGRYSEEWQLDIVVITEGMLQVQDLEVVDPFKASAIGAIKIIPLEYPMVSCRCIDLSGEWVDPVRPAGIVRRELFSASGEVIVAYRNGMRLRPAITKISGRRGPGSRQIRKGGVYLITGGFGGLGFVFANFLSQKYSAHLILLGRSDLPKEEDWDQWLEEHDGSDEMSMRILDMRSMMKRGSKIRWYTGGLKDADAVRGFVRDACDELGNINGILHTAGIADYGGVIQRRDSAGIAGVLDPKVGGTLIIEDLSGMGGADFIAFFSSLGNILYKYKYGQMAYNCANEFLDGYACGNRLPGETAVVAINWDDWSDMGMSLRALGKREKISASLAREELRRSGGISREEGIRAFELILESGWPRVMVSTKDLRVRMAIMEREVVAVRAGAWVADIDAGMGLDLCEGDEERVIKSIFSEYFGKQRIGIDDDFFDLGGDSLKATGFIARLSERVGRRIPLQVFLNAPTIRSLMEYLRATGGAATRERATRERVTGEWATGGGVANGAMHAEMNLVRLNAESGRTLLCFPPAIGYGVSYKQLAALLPAYAFYSFDFLETEERIQQYVSMIGSMAEGRPVVLFGYSAGGGLAFEVAKHMERTGAKVSDLILLDTYVYRDFKGWEDEASPELLLRGMSGDMGGAGVIADRRKAEQKIRRYYHYANTSVSEGMLSAGIHLITATDRLIEERKVISGMDAERLSRFRDFRDLTTGRYREYTGYGKHAEMLDNKFLEKNASLLGGILDKIDWSM